MTGLRLTDHHSLVPFIVTVKKRKYYERMKELNAYKRLKKRMGLGDSKAPPSAVHSDGSDAADDVDEIKGDATLMITTDGAHKRHRASEEPVGIESRDHKDPDLSSEAPATKRRSLPPSSSHAAADGADQRNEPIRGAHGPQPRAPKAKKQSPHHATGSLARAVAVADQRRAEREEAERHRLAQARDREQKRLERERQAKLLQQRTRRGQPVMKNMIDHMLHKLTASNTRETMQRNALQNQAADH